MKKDYTNPEIDIIQYSASDIITTSATLDVNSFSGGIANLTNHSFSENWLHS